MASVGLSNIVDLKVVQGLVGTDYVNKSVLFQTGAMVHDSRPMPTGTLSSIVRTQSWENDQTGQTIGIGGEFATVEKTQTEIVVPIFQKGNMLTIDEIQERAQAGGISPNEYLANSIRENAASIIDTMGIRVMEGVAAAITSNQFDSSDTPAAISLSTLNSAKFTRGDYADNFNRGGIFIANSTSMAALMNLGLVAYTSNTFGGVGTEFSFKGSFPTLLGMNPWMTDKLRAATSGGVLAGNGTGNFCYLLEKGALVVRGDLAPLVRVDPIPKGMGDYAKFMLRLSIGLRLVGWTGTANDLVSETELGDRANWTSKALSDKHIPVARLETT